MILTLLKRPSSDSDPNLAYHYHQAMAFNHVPGFVEELSKSKSKLGTLISNLINEPRSTINSFTQILDLLKTKYEKKNLNYINSSEYLLKCILEEDQGLIERFFCIKYLSMHATFLRNEDPHHYTVSKIYFEADKYCVSLGTFQNSDNISLFLSEISIVSHGKDRVDFKNFVKLLNTFYFPSNYFILNSIFYHQKEVWVNFKSANQEYNLVSCIIEIEPRFISFGFDRLKNEWIRYEEDKKISCGKQTPDSYIKEEILKDGKQNGVRICLCIYQKLPKDPIKNIGLESQDLICATNAAIKSIIHLPCVPYLLEKFQHIDIVKTLYECQFDTKKGIEFSKKYLKDFSSTSFEEVGRDAMSILSSGLFGEIYQRSVSMLQVPSQEEESSLKEIEYPDFNFVAPFMFITNRKSVDSSGVNTTNEVNSIEFVLVRPHKSIPNGDFLLPTENTASSGSHHYRTHIFGLYIIFNVSYFPDFRSIQKDLTSKGEKLVIPLNISSHSSLSIFNGQISKKNYKLYSVIIHSGEASLTGGHYYTLAYREDYGKWFTYDNTTVNEVPDVVKYLEELTQDLTSKRPKGLIYGLTFDEK